MTTSIGEQIIDALVTRAELILEANDYRTDAGARVHIGRPVELRVELPCVCIIPGELTPLERYITNTAIPWVRDFAVELLVEPEDTPHAGAQAEAALADLLTAMLGDETLGGLAHDVELYRANVEYPPAGAVMAAASIGVRVHYVAQYGDPYDD
jgi:hypothetical protein